MKINEITASPKNNEVTLEFISLVKPAAKNAYKSYQRGKALKAADAARKARQATNIFGMSKYSLKGLKGKERKAMIAKRAQVGKAAARGQAVVKSFNTKLLDIVSLLGIGYYFYDYWTQITVVEDDLAEFAAAIKAGTNVSEENMFRGFTSEEEARAEAIAIREELLGMTTINIVLAAGFAASLVKYAGKIISMLPFLGVPGKIIAALGRFAEPLGRPLGAAALIWFETESGKAFLKEWAGIILVIGKGVSSTMSFGIEQLDNLEAYLEKETGKDIPGVPDVVRSKIVPSAADNADADAKDLANSIMIGPVRATDNNGFLRTDSDFFANPGVKNAVGLAIRKGQPNPLDAIPKKPGATYPTFTPSLDRFSW